MTIRFTGLSATLLTAMAPAMPVVAHTQSPMDRASQFETALPCQIEKR